MLNLSSTFPTTDRMPALFIGHGTPMSAINPNAWTGAWGELGRKLPRPRAILVVSAHWLTRGGALVTMSEKPPMNYDMYGFPPPLYDVTYPAPGDIELAQNVASALSSQIDVEGDTQWGFDHATWVVLKYLFPKADVPVIQLSIDYSRQPSFHYGLGKHLQALRTRGVLSSAPATWCITFRSGRARTTTNPTIGRWSSIRRSRAISWTAIIKASWTS
jgi:4,5-DOPA dioxygenase extradiol